MVPVYIQDPSGTVGRKKGVNGGSARKQCLRPIAEGEAG